MTNTNALPTKTQVDALIATCLGAGYNDAAGLLTLASESISENVKRDTEETLCACLEHIGDNSTCQIHGHIYNQNESRFSTDEIKADYRERADLYGMGMGY